MTMRHLSLRTALYLTNMFLKKRTLDSQVDMIPQTRQGQAQAMNSMVVIDVAETLANETNAETSNLRTRLENFDLSKLERERTLLRYLFQDFQNLETNLRLNQMELDMLSGEIRQMLDNSLLRKYLQEREEAVLSTACERASQCVQNIDNVINDTQRNNIQNIQETIGPSPDNNSSNVNTR